MTDELNWVLSIQDGRIIVGRIDGLPRGAVLCFSLVCNARAVSGCKKIIGVGGYTEVLIEEGGREFSLGFEDESYEICNISWLPQGAHLKLAKGGIVQVNVVYDGPDAGAIAPDYGAPSGGLRLVPAPGSWVPAGGVLPCGGGFAPADGAGFAQLFKAVDDLARRNRLGAFLGAEVRLQLSADYGGGDEGYRLEITPEGVTIAASAAAGVFYGAISLLNLRCNHGGEIPCGTITDSPRFSWRGQHLDCARHFFETGTILQLLDLMALFKLNRFHWHFCDDEAFRLEVTSYPEIWQKTRMRGIGELMPGVFGGGCGPAGGSYSLAFAAELIARAGALQIEVLPEIEIPAHGHALTRIYPQLRDPADNTAEISVQGYQANTMNPAMPFTWDFIENLVAELAGIFPFAHIHLGCDERPENSWRNSPAARALMQQEGLKTPDDLQGWMMQRVGRIVTGHGARPCAWEEAVKGGNGGIGNDAILFSWTGQGPGLAAARAGYKVVMCPAQNVYFDLAHSEDFAQVGARWAGTVSLEDTVEWVPVPVDEPELEANIIGVQGQFWSEFTIEDADLWPMLIPRILGLSETGWRAIDDRATAASIRQSVADNQPLLRALGGGGSGWIYSGIKR